MPQGRYGFTKEQIEKAKAAKKVLFGFEYRGAGYLASGGLMKQEAAERLALFCTMVQKGKDPADAYDEAYAEKGPKCNCGASTDPGACGHHPDCPMKPIEG